MSQKKIVIIACGILVIFLTLIAIFTFGLMSVLQNLSSNQAQSTVLPNKDSIVQKDTNNQIESIPQNQEEQFACTYENILNELKTNGVKNSDLSSSIVLGKENYNLYFSKCDSISLLELEKGTELNPIQWNLVGIDNASNGELNLDQKLRVFLVKSQLGSLYTVIYNLLDKKLVSEEKIDGDWYLGKLQTTVKNSYDNKFLGVAFNYPGVGCESDESCRNLFCGFYEGKFGLMQETKGIYVYSYAKKNISTVLKLEDTGELSFEWNDDYDGLTYNVKDAKTSFYDEDPVSSTIDCSK